MITSPAISGYLPALQETLEQQDRDHHQDDHHQYVNQVVRAHVPHLPRIPFLLVRTSMLIYDY